MILCVDPDPGSRDRTSSALREAGFETAGAGSLAEAREALEGASSLDCVVTEYDLGDGTGLELVDAVRTVSPDAACVLFTETALDEVDTAAFETAVAEYVSKSRDDAHEELRSLVEHAVAFQSQTAYPLPDNETARLAALEQYAADPAELGESLDRLTAFAIELLGVDAAAVGLVDDHHEEFLSCHGIALDTIDREDTICTYALLEEGVTVVEDVQADPRFRGDESLVAAGIRFYASATLRTPDGQAIGTFCVYDDDPRTLSARDHELLEMLADEAMDQLELRRRLRQTGGETDG
jgi:GAF domain-containing protein